MTGIYKIENLVNGKVYIGQAVDIECRWISHISMLKNNKHHSKHLQNSWNKYGEENFKFEIIEECSFEELNEKEIYWINKFKENCYNLTSGGDGGDTFSKRGVISQEITRNKLSVVQRNRLKNGVSIETRKKMAMSKYGNTWNKGRKHTQESIENMRLAKLGKKRKPFKHHPHSLETRQKISLSNKGKHSVNYQSTETRKQSSERMKKNNPARKSPVLQFDLDNNLLNEFNSIKEAKLATNIVSISDCCRGLQKTAGGFIWKYKNQCGKDMY